jgi:hypothetical protein
MMVSCVAREYVQSVSILSALNLNDMYDSLCSFHLSISWSVEIEHVVDILH